LDRVDGYDAVFAGCDEGFGVGENEGGDLADVQVLEEAGGLGAVSYLGCKIKPGDKVVSPFYCR
jgi:hypothetical protein